MEEDQFLGFGGYGASPQRAQEFGRVTGTKQMVENPSKKSTPGGRASKNGLAMVSNKQLNKECSQLSGKVTQARKMVRKAMKKEHTGGISAAHTGFGESHLAQAEGGRALEE